MSFDACIEDGWSKFRCSFAIRLYFHIEKKKSTLFYLYCLHKMPACYGCKQFTNRTKTSRLPRRLLALVPLGDTTFCGGQLNSFLQNGCCFSGLDKFCSCCSCSLPGRVGSRGPVGPSVSISRVLTRSGS